MTAVTAEREGHEAGAKQTCTSLVCAAKWMPSSRWVLSEDRSYLSSMQWKPPPPGAPPSPAWSPSQTWMLPRCVSRRAIFGGEARRRWALHIFPGPWATRYSNGRCIGFQALSKFFRPSSCPRPRLSKRISSYVLSPGWSRGSIHSVCDDVVVGSCVVILRTINAHYCPADLRAAGWVAPFRYVCLFLGSI